MPIYAVMMRTLSRLIAVLLLLALPGCHRHDAKVELRVFAAASLQDAMRELAKRYDVQHPGVTVELNFAGSNALARQIESSRAADVYFSADEKWMDYLDQKKLLVPGSRRSVLTNSLVIVARKESTVKITGPVDLATAHYEHLVLAQPDAVPAGRYAKHYLQGIKYQGGTLWDAVKARLVPALDVRAALAAVAADPRRVGIVYSSDLVQSQGVKALYRVPVEDGPPIRYPVALIAGRAHPALAKALLAYLESPDAATVYRRFGFGMLEPLADGRQPK